MIYRSFVPFPKYFLQSFSFQKSLFWIFNWSKENAILECVAKTSQNANVKMKSYIVSHFWRMKAFLLYFKSTRFMAFWDFSKTLKCNLDNNIQSIYIYVCIIIIRPKVHWNTLIPIFSFSVFIFHVPTNSLLNWIKRI